MMVPVHLTIPATLMRRFRETAALYDTHSVEMFTWGLRVAVAEFMFHHECTTPVDRPWSFGPLVTMNFLVPYDQALYVAHLAGRSGLTQAEAWHVVIEEFVAREVSPTLSLEAA
jgi:hypothetical protein